MSTAFVEVHMTHIAKRGLESVPAAAAAGTIAGFGVQSHLLGPEAMLRLLSADR